MWRDKLSKITVQKFSSNNVEQNIRVPLLSVKLLSQFISKSAISELHKHGIDINAILDAVKNGDSYSSSFKVEEDGIEKVILITVS